MIRSYTVCGVGSVRCDPTPFATVYGFGGRSKKTPLQTVLDLLERILWQAIRGKRLGVEFHRQVPLDKFIVDFYCHELMLAIEIDGFTHGTEEARERDLTRQAKLESLGVSFLRFYDGDVKENLQGVLAEIVSWVLRHGGTSP